MIEIQPIVDILMEEEFFIQSIVDIAYNFLYADSFDGKKKEYQIEELEAMLMIMTGEGDFIKIFCKLVKAINCNKEKRVEWLEKILESLISKILDYQKKVNSTARYASPIMTLYRLFIILLFNIVDLKADGTGDSFKEFDFLQKDFSSYNLEFANFRKIQDYLKTVFERIMASKKPKKDKKGKQNTKEPNIDGQISHFFFKATIQLFKNFGFMREIFHKTWASWGDEELQDMIEHYHVYQLLSSTCDYAFCQLSINFLKTNQTMNL